MDTLVQRSKFMDACKYLRSKQIVVRYFGTSLWEVKGYSLPSILVEPYQIIQLADRLRGVSNGSN